MHAVVRFSLTGSLSLILAGFSQVGLADTTYERESLEMILRQLDTIEAIADRSATTSHPDQRYQFDYSQLQRDVAAMRSGIQAYLAPVRAQPRHPPVLNTEMNNQYQRSGNRYGHE